MNRSVLSTRVRQVAATLAAGAAIAAFAPASAASASPVPIGATGTSVITLGGAAVKALQSGGCGALTGTPVNGAVLSQTVKGQFRIALKVSGLLVDPGTGGIRIDHAGGVTLSNDCYTIGLTSFRITDYGTPDQSTAFDLNAVTHSVDDSGRQVIGQLDFANANITVTQHGAIRITKLDLLASAEGAQELNQLTSATGAGPFFAGEKVGNAKTTIKLVF